MTSPLWAPLTQTVTSITNANPGVVTTANPHGYFTGAIVQFFFPANFGMTELIGPNKTYIILVLSPTTFTISVDTTNFTHFAISSSLQSPQVFPVGEVASTLANRERNMNTPTPT